MQASFCETLGVSHSNALWDLQFNCCCCNTQLYGFFELFTFVCCSGAQLCHECTSIQACLECCPVDVIYFYTAPNEIYLCDNDITCCWRVSSVFILTLVFWAEGTFSRALQKSFFWSSVITSIKASDEFQNMFVLESSITLYFYLFIYTKLKKFF